MTASNSNAYNSYRDDFPANQPGAYDGLTEVWRQELPHPHPERRPRRPSRQGLRHGRQPHRVARQPLLGLRPAGKHHGPPPVRLLSFKTPNDQEDKTSWGDRVAFAFHVVVHIFDGTRWSRTGHIIR